MASLWTIPGSDSYSGINLMLCDGEWAYGTRNQTEMIRVELLTGNIELLFTGSSTFGTSGSNLILLAMGQGSIKLYSYIISVGITAFIHVKSQKYTGNIWAGVPINSLIICMITVANCNSITAF